MLAALKNELEQHPANTNPFFRSFREQRLNQDQLQMFLRQYHYFCKHFVKELEGLLYRTPVDQVEMRTGLVKTLHSELGGGIVERAHITLLERFCRAAGLPPAALARTVPLPEVDAYLSVLRTLFVESHYLVALGAELAVEVTAGAEFEYLYPGLQQYPGFQSQDLEFFRLHLVEEAHHSAWLWEAVHKTAKTEEEQALVRSGALEAAMAWLRFWQGLYRAVFLERVPASA